jgi:hypothetical protein
MIVEKSPWRLMTKGQNVKSGFVSYRSHLLRDAKEKPPRQRAA